ncbi:Acetyltransferase Pat [Mariniblastus fucicola]|uniref:Acetyltransferase Pat n=2 Tax=Mariniblastus fucicola TaxID=980251 RepID=A0A5B9PIF3_9BACT|nr:Acetyltransferase Pat [Mariniblastus fucicola]
MGFGETELVTTRPEVTMDVKDYFVESTLRDGSPVILRAIRPTDKQALQTALQNLGSDSRYSRFFYPKRKLTDRELKFYTELDFERHVAIGVGLIEDDESLPIGIARYIVDDADPTRAEVAFTVADEFQSLGVGSLLLKHLSLLAVKSGVGKFAATTFAENEKMIRVFARSNRPMSCETADGMITVTIDLLTN